MFCILCGFFVLVFLLFKWNMESEYLICVFVIIAAYRLNTRIKKSNDINLTFCNGIILQENSCNSVKNLEICQVLFDQNHK